METVLYWIAGVSTALFAVRLILLFVGVDGADTPDDPGMVGDVNDAASAADFKVFTILTLVVTLMIGSWASLLLLAWEWAPWYALSAG
jgi:hypothetical protein